MRSDIATGTPYSTTITVVTHSGGKATCNKGAVCETCEEVYTGVDPANHDSSLSFDEDGFCINGCYEPKPEVCEVFSDVNHGAWYEAAVQYVYDNGIMSGNNGLFNPTGNITRAQMASILQRFCEGNDL